MRKNAAFWRKSLLFITLITFIVAFLSLYVQENYGVQIYWWLLGPLWLAFAGTMSMTLITGGRAKVKQSVYDDTPLHSYDKLVGNSMMIGGVFVILMMILGLCTMCQAVVW